MGNLMIEHDVCHVSVFPSWFGIGWVVIALAECNTIRVKCGIPWQVNPNGWPCQGPLHVTPPIGIISLGAIALGPIALGANSVGAISVGEISLEQNFGRRAAGNGQCTSQDSLVHSRTHGWRPSAARNRRYNCVEGAIGNSVAPLHRELAPRMVL